MTTHVRQQIREAAATTLTSLATTGTNVFQSRMRPRGASGLPCLLIETNDESIVPGSVGTTQQRELTLTVRGFEKGGATLDDTLDTIALEVETALAANASLSGKCSGMELTAIKVDFDDATDQPVGEIAIDYRITYFVLSGSPGSVI